MTTTTFDASTASAGVTLSGGDLVASRTAGAGIFGVFGFTADGLSSGQRYFEVTIDSGASILGWGFATPTSTYANLDNDATVGACVFASGNLWINGSNTGSIGAGIGAGDSVGIAVDFTAHLVWARILPSGNWNNNALADPATGVGGRTIPSGTFVPSLTLGNGSGQASFNFGALSFLGTQPSGFTDWLAAPPPSITGTFDVTESFTDTFTGAGYITSNGTFNVTENPDVFSPGGGIVALSVDSQVSTVHANPVITGFSTDGPDRILVFTYYAAMNSVDPGFIDTLTDTSGKLTWTAQDSLSASALDNTVVSQQIFWAYAHDKVENIDITATWTGSAPDNYRIGVFAVAGLNGRYYTPWDTNRKANGSAIGLGFLGGGSSPMASSGDINTDAQQGMLIAFGAYGDPSLLLALDTPTPSFVRRIELADVGSQRNIASEVATKSVGLLSGSPGLTIGITPATKNWSLLWDALAVAVPNPGSMITFEDADGFHAVGYQGGFGSTGFLEGREAKDTATIIGYVSAVGFFISTEADDTFSAYGFQPLTGTFVTVERPDIFHGTGIGLGEDGIFVVTEAVDIFVAEGYAPASGTFDTTEPADRFVAIGAGVIQVRRRRVFFTT